VKRRTLWIVLISVLCSVVLAIGGALIWLRSHLDTFVKTAIETHGSAIIGASVQVGAVHVDTAQGELTLRQFVIHNPAGFHTPHILRVDTLRVGVDLASVRERLVLIRHIDVIAPDVIWERGAHLSNLDTTERNIAAYRTKHPPKIDLDVHFLIEKIVVRDAHVQAAVSLFPEQRLRVPLPNFTLHELGKPPHGIAAGDIAHAFIEALRAQLPHR